MRRSNIRKLCTYVLYLTVDMCREVSIVCVVIIRRTCTSLMNPLECTSGEAHCAGGGSTDILETRDMTGIGRSLNPDGLISFAHVNKILIQKFTLLDCAVESFCNRRNGKSCLIALGLCVDTLSC